MPSFNETSSSMVKRRSDVVTGRGGKIAVDIERADVDVGLDFKDAADADAGADVNADVDETIDGIKIDGAIGTVCCVLSLSGAALRAAPLLVLANTPLPGGFM